jgi:predicted Zn-dependent protease with MMP-like domain
MVTRGRLPLAVSWGDGEADSDRVGAASAAPKATANITPASAKQAVIFSIGNPLLTPPCSTVAHPAPCRQPLGWRENLPYNVVMTSQFDDWQGLVAPSLADIETLAAQAYARLPGHFRKLCEGLVIRVEDFPAADVVDSMRLESDFDLLGLFQGVGLPFQSETAPELMPNMIWLYRRPILDFWAEHEDTLGEIVTHVLVHEIGHHFGLSDEDIEAIEASAT